MKKLQELLLACYFIYNVYMQQSTYSKTGEKNFLNFFKLANLHATIYIYLYCTKIERIKNKIINQY